MPEYESEQQGLKRPPVTPQHLANEVGRPRLAPGADLVTSSLIPRLRFRALAIALQD